MLADEKAFDAAKTKWVRSVSQSALDMALDAGNPRTYSTEIDGTTGSGGQAQAGAGFKAGPLSAATHSARVIFLAKPLVQIANSLRPMLEQTIRSVFPTARGRLQRSFVWWVANGSKKDAQYVKLRFTIPDKTITIYDVLWLAPEGTVKDTPAWYAWWANQMVKRQGAGHRFNLVIRHNKKTGITTTRVRKRPRGYLAEATNQMRNKVGRYSGVTVQGFIVKKRFTGPNTPARFGVPVVRVAFRKNLTSDVNV